MTAFIVPVGAIAGVFVVVVVAMILVSVVNGRRR